MVMLLVTAFVSFVVLATAVTAGRHSHHPSSHHPYPRSLSITKEIDPSAKYCPAEKDRKRFKHLMNKVKPVNSSNLVESSETADSGLALNNTGPGYTAKIGVGSPPTYYDLAVDTGSSNTWVGAKAPYVKTNTSVDASESVVVGYGTGSFKGNLYYDTVTIAPGVSASKQPIGAAYNTSGNFPDGILGLGPRGLTLGTMLPNNASVIPTVTDSLFAQGAIKQNLVAVSFEPVTSGFTVNGELTFGFTDPTKYIGDISYFPITNNTFAGMYWGIDAAIQYGGTSGASVSLTDTTAGIVDTGTTLILLSTGAFTQYVGATGAVYDSKTRLLSITAAQYGNLQSLYFAIGDETFELTPNAQILSRVHSVAFDGAEEDTIYLAINQIGEEDQTNGVEFILGMAFMERVYCVFDTGNHRIGLARTQFTNATTN